MVDDVITLYPALDIVADAGGSRETTPRGKTTRFMDTYDILSFVGQKQYDTDTTVTFSGTYAEVIAVDSFAKSNIVTPFWFSFAEDELAWLYNINGSFSVSHVGGLKYSITLKLKEAEVFGIVGSEKDLSLIADYLHQTVNVLLPTTESAYEVTL